MHVAVVALAALLGDAPGYALAGSENFSVYAPTRREADAILAKAETWRAELALEWLGKPLSPGAGRTLIHVKLVPSENRGRSAVMDRVDDPRGNLVWIEAGRLDGEAFDATLKHELTHCVLASRHPTEFPAWAHEGCAGQYDSGERRRLHERTVARFAREGDWPRLSRILSADSLHAGDATAYGTAVSLASYLISLKDRRTLAEFAAAGAGGDWDAALENFYGIRDVEELQAGWEDWARRTGGEPRLE